MTIFEAHLYVIADNSGIDPGSKSKLLVMTTEA